MMRLFFSQVEKIIANAHSAGMRVRVVGSALSPNGLGLSEDTMLSLAECDRVLSVDRLRKTVTVEVSTVHGKVAPYSIVLSVSVSATRQVLAGRSLFQ